MKNNLNKVFAENIRVPVSATDGDVISEAEKRFRAAGVGYEPNSVHIYRKSVDARRRDKISLVCSVIADTFDEKAKNDSVKIKAEQKYEIIRGNEKPAGRPVIVGFGPAGLFCSLSLAEAGMKPLVLERGASVEKRISAIERFYDKGELDVNTNVQFGAGGAGTFSDGKLTTRIGDYRCSYILKKFCQLGAPEDILWKAKPHVGTDILRNVITEAAAEITRLGGEIRYECKVSEVGNDYIVSDGEKIEAGCVIIATGHSARDTYSMLMQKGFALEPKPFSIGVRAEHLQYDIDRALYGDPELSEKLGHAEYQLSHRRGERGVYTFCMCPGGEVMAAASETGGVVTNGMSRHARNGRNANAAVAVSVLPKDFGNTADGAISFQRSLEAAAYKFGGKNYYAPCQLLGNFMADKYGDIKSKIKPTYMDGKVTPAKLGDILPPFVSEMLKIGFNCFGKSIRDYNAPDVVLTGIETRTSAPVRIIRGENLNAPGYSNVYPCGEGAGYAGGIMSAAVDGLRIAETILKRFSSLI